MPRRSDFLSAITAGTRPSVAAASVAAANKIGTDSSAQGLGHDEFASLQPAAPPQGFSIPESSAPPPPPGATDAAVSLWRARYGIEFPNVKGTPAGESARLNALHLPPTEWKSFSIERPTILKSTLADLDGLLFYAPETRLSAGDLAHAQRSVGPGIAYLPTAGTWWLYYNGTATTAWTAIDASDPIVAARYVGEQGASYWSNGTISAPSSASNSVELVPANRDRRGLIFQNQDGTVAVAIRQLNGSATPVLGLAAGSASFRLGPSGEIFFTGDQAARGRYVVQSTTAAAVLVGFQQMF